VLVGVNVAVFDSFSSARTVEIAEEFGARVIQRKFDNWSAHQNRSKPLPLSMVLLLMRKINSFVTLSKNIFRLNISRSSLLKLTRLSTINWPSIALSH